MILHVINNYYTDQSSSDEWHETANVYSLGLITADCQIRIYNN